MLAHRLRRWPNIKTTLAQRLLFAGGSALPGSLYCALAHLSPVMNSVVQSQKAVSAYFASKQIPPFGLAGQCW